MIVIDKESDLGKIQTSINTINENFLKLVQAMHRHDKIISSQRCYKVRLYLFMLIAQLNEVDVYIENNFEKPDESRKNYHSSIEKE